jgi:hypothetical protein
VFVPQVISYETEFRLFGGFAAALAIIIVATVFLINRIKNKNLAQNR